MRDGTGLVAVSGGADSVALLRGLMALQPEFGWQLAVAHFDHRIRGDESAADAEWVRNLAAALQLPWRIGAAATPSNPSAMDEEHARRLRYAFLEQAARELDCPVIATAHTADDQAETVLHHLLRGTGIAGLRGIPLQRRAGSVSSRSLIVRPMLGVTRDQVLTYLDGLKQDFRHDSTNVNPAMTRNWLRQTIFPELRQRWPYVVQSLCRLAEQAEELSSTLTQLAQELLATAMIDDSEEAVRLDVSRLTGRPRHLVRQVFVELWQRRGWPLRDMGYEQWNRLADLVTADGVAQFPGAIEARRRGGLLILSTTVSPRTQALD